MEINGKFGNTIRGAYPDGLPVRAAATAPTQPQSSEAQQTPVAKRNAGSRPKLTPRGGMIHSAAAWDIRAVVWLIARLLFC